MLDTTLKEGRLLNLAFQLIHIGRNIYYSSTYMQYLRDYCARISLPISYLVTD